MTTTGKIVTGFIVGAAAGTLLGILFAPKEGAKTRALIADKANQMKDGLNKGYKKAKSSFGIGETPGKELAVN